MKLFSIENNKVKSLSRNPFEFEKDIQKLEKLYSKDDILFYLKNTKELVSNKVCLMVSKRYKTASFMRFNKV